jgi:EAL and modified HD-GYP domain-containing signal transduction protein
MSFTAPPRPSAAAPPSSAAAPPITTPNRFLGRQPILDLQRRLFGYELLYRPGPENQFSGDPEQATREVIDHWLLLIPDANRTASFVNCTRSALAEGLVTLLPPSSTVLEIPEFLDPDPELLSACLTLRMQGYRFALDSFLPRSARKPFLPLADFIKIDFQTAVHDLRREIYAMVAGTGARLVAEKIENDIQLRIAISEGCTLFQGYFFSQPVILTSHTVSQNYFVYLKLLAELHHDPSNLRKIEKLISGDASLCYRILRVANSALQGHPGVVSTIREALLMVGEYALRRMVTVAMAGALSQHRPAALLSMALARAEFCELLAGALSAEPAQFYLLGLLSLLDALFEIPLDRILESIPLSPAMKAALIGDNSVPARSLDLVRALESCDWGRCEQIQHQLGISEGVIADNYAQALRWASMMLGEQTTP